MFTIEELQKGVYISTNLVKVEFVGSSKLIHFSKPVNQNVSSVSKLFYTDVPTLWELIEDDDQFTNEQFVLFTNMLIKDLMKYYDLISF